MPTVKFTSPDEFCTELQKDKATLSRPIVRCTNRIEPSRLSCNIRLVTVLASYAVRNADGKIADVVKLETFCGELWGINKEEDEKVWVKAEAIAKKIEGVCTDCKLELRAGNID